MRAPHEGFLRVNVSGEDGRGRVKTTTYEVHKPPIELCATSLATGGTLRWTNFDVSMPQEGTIRQWRSSRVHVAEAQEGEEGRSRDVGDMVTACHDAAEFDGSRFETLFSLLRKPIVVKERGGVRMEFDAMVLKREDIMDGSGFDMVPYMQTCSGVIRCARFMDCMEVSIAAHDTGEISWAHETATIRQTAMIPTCPTFLASVKFVNFTLPLRTGSKLLHSNGMAFLDAFMQGLDILQEIKDMLHVVDVSQVSGVEVRTQQPQGFCVTDISPETLGWSKVTGRLIFKELRARRAWQTYAPRGVERVREIAASHSSSGTAAFPTLDCDLWTSPMDADALFLSLCCVVAHTSPQCHERPVIVERAVSRLTKGKHESKAKLIRSIDEHLRVMTAESLESWNPFAHDAADEAGYRDRYLKRLRRFVSAQMQKIDDEDALLHDASAPSFDAVRRAELANAEDRTGVQKFHDAVHDIREAVDV